MLENSNIDASETIVDTADANGRPDAVLVAQAATDQAGAASGGAPGISIVVPDADNRVMLAANASIETIQLDGNDLLLIQPDGSQIRIIGGALNVPTFVIGDIEVPQEVLVAALETSGFNVAAGPDNTLSVTQPGPTGSGGELENSSGATIVGEQLRALGLLGDDASGGDGGATGDEILDSGNVASVLTGGVSSGGIVESADNPGGVDADPVAATGSISFFDPEFGETRDAEVASRTVVSQALSTGGPLTAAQLDALLAGFSLDTPGGVTVESTSAAGGSIGWTYLVGNDAVDFLAEGDVVTLSFDVRINDGISSVVQTVTVTVTGTNDVPVIGGIVSGDVVEDIAGVRSVQDDFQSYGVGTGAGWSNGFVGRLDAADTQYISENNFGIYDGAQSISRIFSISGNSGFVVVEFDFYKIDSWDDESLLVYLNDGQAFTFRPEGNVAGGLDGATGDIALGALTGSYSITSGGVDSQLGGFGFALDRVYHIRLELDGVGDDLKLGFGNTLDEDFANEDFGIDNLTIVDARILFTEGDLTIADVDTGQSSFIAQASVAGDNGLGTFTLDANGHWTFTADGAQAAVQALGANDTLTETFTATSFDGTGSQLVTVTIQGTNDVPVVAAINVTGGVTEAVTPVGDLSDSGTISFTDVDLSDTHSIDPTAITASTGALGSLTASVSKQTTAGLGGEITWNYTVAASAVEYLAEGETRVESFTITLDDGHGGTVDRTIEVTVTGTNDVPVITSGAQTGSVAETADIVGGVDPDPAAAIGTISFLDVDLSDDPEASHDGGTVSNMSFAHGYTPTDEQIAALKAGFSLDDAALSNFSNVTGIGSTGWTYQVTNDVVDFLGDGDSVELTYVVTIDDGIGGAVSQNVVITVTGTSDAPTVSAANNFVVSEEDLTNGNSGALTFTGDVGLNFNDYSSVGLSSRLKTSGAIPLDPAGDLILLKSDGVSLGYSLLTRPGVSQTLAAFKPSNGEIIFVLEIKIVPDGSGGFKVDYTFELRGNLDHIGPGDGNSMPLDFTVTARNSAGETTENTFTVTINDDAPDAVNVTAAMEENTATLISLVEGDGATVEAGEAYISGADDVTVTIGTPTYSNLPAGVVPGTPGISLVQTATGYDVSITPGAAFDALAEGESMLMEIPFTVTDGDGDMVTKVITVTVSGTNDQPVISAVTDVSETLTETNAALSTTGSFDVADVDTSDVVTITGVTVATSGTGVNAATPGTAALLGMFGPNSGVVIDSLSSTGTVNWSFDAASDAFAYLKAGESLELTYTVHVADGNGGTVEQNVTITVNGTNDVPVIAPIVQPVAVAEISDASAQDISPVTGTLSVTDAEAGDTLTAQAGTPVISWSGGALSAAQQAALTAALASGALTLGSAVSNGGAVGIAYSWDPAAADLDFLAAGQSLTVSYDVTVSDGTATSASQSLIFTIAGTNDLPVAWNDNPNGSLPAFEISEDEIVTRVFDVLGNDTLDPDSGAANSISLGTIRGYGLPGVAQGQILDPLTSGLFTISVDINNQIQVELNSSALQLMRRGEVGKIVIDYKLHGDGTDVDTGSLQVAVTGSNDAPILDASASPVMTQAEDSGLPSGLVGTLVSDLVNAAGGSVGNVDDVDGQPFPAGMSISAVDSSQGSWYYHHEGSNAPDGRPYWFNLHLELGKVLNLGGEDRIYFVPNADYTGTVDEAITFRAWDGVASPAGMTWAPGSVGGETAYSTATDTVSLTVENVNDAPVLVTNIADKTVFSNVGADVDISGSFSDIDPGDVLSYSATLAGGDPLPAWLSIDETTGRLTGTAPSVGAAGGRIEITVTATDSGGLSVSDTFELTIDGGPEAPVITAHTDGGVTEDASYTGGTNLLTNGGFETGSTSGWVASKISVSGYEYYVHSGGYGAGGTSYYINDVPFTCSQTFDTVAGVTYTVSFWVENKAYSATGAIDNSVLVTWDGATVGSVIDLAYATGKANFTEFSYTFTANSDTSTLALAVTNNVGYTYIDDISVVQLPGTEVASGTISFTDGDVGETHTASFTPSAAGYVGTFSAAVSTESSGGTPGTVDWTFDVADADIQHLAAGETVTQTYTVTIDDGNGGTVSEDIDVVLTGVNDAPVLNAALDPIVWTATDAVLPGVGGGTLVSDLADSVGGGGLNNVSDVDSPSIGIAITGQNTAHGSWYFSTDNGANWSVISGVTDANALTLTADARVVFVPDPAFNGAVSDGLTIRAWDGTGGANGSYSDTTSNGGTTGYSSATDTVSLAVAETGSSSGDDIAGDEVTVVIPAGRASMVKFYNDDVISSEGGDDAVTGDVTNFELSSLNDAQILFGHDYLSGGSGGDVILGDVYHYEDADTQGALSFALFGNDRIAGGDDADAIFGDGYSARITATSNSTGGTNFGSQFVLGGDDTLDGDDGADVLYGDFHSVHVNGDAGLLIGGADTLRGGAGDDTLHGDFGIEILTNGGVASGGNDTLNGGLGRDTLNGGGGADTFVFDLDALQDAGANIRDLIADYDFAEGDVVDLSALLGSETVAGHEGDYVKMNGAFLEVDVDGTGGAAGFVQIAEFTDVPVLNGLRILVDDDPADVTVVI
ncbi:VCBS domain-containing protein [Hoeflea sp.]|uniref:VCBS domain-containing protein n=1 Tax=Hoeflea sp. TaxID=1940281 RepID=UPI003A91F269